MIGRVGAGVGMRGGVWGRPVLSGPVLSGLVLSGLALAAGGTGWARSLHFDAPVVPPGPVEPPTPRRAGPLFLSLGLGVEALLAQWHEPSPVVDDRLQQLGPALRLEAGVVVHEGITLFAEAAGTFPALPPAWGLEMGGAGAGIDWFLRPDGPWHLQTSVRRSWAFRSRPLSGEALTFPRPISNITDIWQVELGVGRVHRQGRLDRGWGLSVFGGPLWVTTGIGWTGGASIGYRWSRS
jgi:hypothetical protein